MSRAVTRCARALKHSAELAELAAASPYPHEGATYLLDTLDELSGELRMLRAAVRARRQ